MRNIYFPNSFAFLSSPRQLSSPARSRSLVRVRRSELDWDSYAPVDAEIVKGLKDEQKTLFKELTDRYDSHDRGLACPMLPPIERDVFRSLCILLALVLPGGELG
jgi:hypothetical protein